MTWVPRKKRLNEPNQAFGAARGNALVHAGILRSQFAETSEAIFLTQGHVYGTAEECEARFNGDEPGFVYARFSNPTVAMFESGWRCSREPRRRARRRAAWRP